MFCPNCGTELVDTAKFCIECGCNLREAKQPPITTQKVPPTTSVQSTPSLKCPKCHNTNVTVQLVESGQVTNRNGIGIDGQLHNAGRKIVAISTLGLSNLFIPKAEGKNSTKTIMRKIAICQNCGNSWSVR